MSGGTPYKDQLPGGLGDEKSPSDFDQEQLKQGVKVEMEHTDDPTTALEIAIDHLTEDTYYYYEKLKTIEEPGTHDTEGIAFPPGKGLGPGGGDPSKYPFNPGDRPKRVRERIVKFLSENPDPDDAAIHELADSLDISPHDLEEEIYSLLSDFLQSKNVSRKGKDRNRFIEGDDYRKLLAEIVLSLYGRNESALAKAAVRLFMRRR